MNKYLNYTIILFLILSLGLFLNYIQYIKDVSLSLFNGSFIYFFIFIIVVLINIFLYFSKPLFIYFVNSFLIIYLFILNISNNSSKSIFVMIYSSILFSVLFSLFSLSTIGLLDYRLGLIFVAIVAFIIYLYFYNLNDDSDKVKYIMECFCENKDSNLPLNFNGPCMTSNNELGIAKNGKCIKKCKSIDKNKKNYNLNKKLGNVKNNNINNKKQQLLALNKYNTEIKSRTKIPKYKLDIKNSLKKPTRDNFDFWCKYTNGLAYNAASVSPVDNDFGYSIAKCSKDISNNTNNYYLYTDCFKNNSKFSINDLNNICKEKNINTNVNLDSVGAYNCPIGQVRYKCSLLPTDYNN